MLSSASNTSLVGLPLLTTLLLLLGLTVRPALSLTLPSGRHIPSELPAARRHAVYELVHGYHLIGPRRRFNLRAVLDHGTSIDVPPIRNMPWLDAEAPSVRTAAGFTVVTSRAGQVLSIRGNGLALTPLDAALYPNVFVHSTAGRMLEKSLALHDSTLPSPSPSPVSYDFHGDIVYIPNITATPSVSVTGAPVMRQAFDECLDKRVRKQVEVALLYDHRVCARYGGEAAATAAVRGALALANTPYEAQTCLSLELVYIEGDCNATTDPLAFLDSVGSNFILDEFTKFMNENRSSIHRDIALFLPGFSDGSRVSGVAYFGAACNERWGYGWAENVEPLVIAHEVGHMLNADHADGGLMKPSWRTGDPLRFADQSVFEIADFIDTKPQAACVETISTPSPSSSPSASPTASVSMSILPSIPVTPSVSPSATPTLSPSTSPSGSPAVLPSAFPSTTSLATEFPRALPPTTQTPVPMLTVLPPSPSPPGATVARSCASGYARWNVLRCTGPIPLRIVHVRAGAEGPILHSVQVRMRQEYGSFAVLYRTVTNGSYIKSIGQVVSPQWLRLNKVDIPEDTQLFNGLGRRYAKIIQDSASITIPPSTNVKTCCRKKLFVYFKAQLCSTGRRCQTRSFRVPHVVRCSRCRWPKPFVPSSLTGRCPFCNHTRTST